MHKHGVVKLGADPELFLYNQDSNVFRSAIGLVGGEKKNPRLINHEIGLGVLEDGVAVEFNIEPVETAGDFVQRITDSFHIIAKEVAYPKKLMLSIRSSAEFPAKELKDDRALISGCDPDFDAYKRGEMREIIELKHLKNMRCAGGHIHFGYDKEKAQTPDWAIVQFLDAFALLGWQRHFHMDEQFRRKYYGVPGCFRPKDYGLEYRTPSPTWMNFNGNDQMFIQTCHRTVAGLLSDDVRTREIYDLIDWGDVHNALTKGFDFNERNVLTLRKSLQPLVQEVTARGAKYLTKEKTAKKKLSEQLAQAGGGVRLRGDNRRREAAQLVMDDVNFNPEQAFREMVDQQQVGIPRAANG